MKAYPCFITTTSDGTEYTTIFNGDGTDNCETVITKKGVSDWQKIELPQQDPNQPIYIY